MLWYYVAGKEKAGPFNPDEFNALVKNGTITPKTLVWNKTFENWQRFETINYQVESPGNEVVIVHEKDEFGEDVEAGDIETDITIKVEKQDDQESIAGECVETKPTGHNVSFTGAAGEYFKIWIVNLFLTIATLGIYAAWAKVRTRKYFYANTRLDGDSFDYLANPIALLKGNLIIVGFFILFQITTSVMPVLSLLIIFVFVAALPFLIYKSLCFNARNTAFRNIRFRFNGTLKESYKVFMLLPICFPLTMGLIAPYWHYRLKKYFFENFSFGSAKNRFTGTPGFFYETFLLALGLMVLLMLAIFIIFAAIGVAASAFQGTGSPDMRVMERTIVPLVILFYVIAIVVSTAFKTFIYVKLTNYAFENTSIGNVTLKSNYFTKSLLWIRMTNIPAIIFSIGLLAPWAKVRTYNYMAENITVFSDMNLDNFTASADDEVGALGESAVDFFDMEIGF